MTKRSRMIRHLCLALAAVSAVHLHAKAPMVIGNSSEAIQLYQDGTLNTLRERCTAIKSDGLLDRPELRAIRNGYVLVQDSQTESGRYSAFAYDQDKRTFWMVDGQTLARGTKVGLKLALPRDYARCRVVRNRAGEEQIEVLHTERNQPTETLAFNRQLKEAREIGAASSGSDACLALPGPKWVAPDDRLLTESEALPWRACHEPTRMLRERLARLVRRVHGL